MFQLIISSMKLNSFVSIWMLCLIVGSASAIDTNQVVSQQVNLSEFEYRIIDIEEHTIDFSMNNFSSNCDSHLVEIVSSTGDKSVQKAEPSLKSAIRQLIVFSNEKPLIVTILGLLSNSSLITYVDDASLPDSDSSNLNNLKIFPIQGEQTCDHLHKISDTSFCFECASNAANSDGIKTVSLYVYTTSTSFSSTDGIDLSQLTPTITVLQFDPRVQYSPIQLSNRLLQQDPKEQRQLKGEVSSLSIFSQDDLSKFVEDLDQQNESNYYYSSLEPFSSSSSSDDESNLQQLETEKLEFLLEYYNCERQTSFYQNTTSQVFNYYRTCFAEQYNFKGIQNGLVEGTTIKYSTDDIELSVQGVQQFTDRIFALLDFSNGLLFYIQTGITSFQCFPSFLKYLYGQKYLNIYLKTNKDLEFTFQDATPDQLVINTEGYILSYSIDFSKPYIHMSSYPITVSISQFVDQVNQINNKNIVSSTKSALKSSNLMSVYYDFDTYLYYISIKYTDQQSSYYLIIDRALVDGSTDIKINPQAIELDYLSLSEESQLFHYLIPGLFQNNAPSRVKLFEQRKVTPNDKLPAKESQEQSQDTMELLVTSFLWKSALRLEINTKQFDDQSSCVISLNFDPKIGSQTQDGKQINIVVNLIPRMFEGVLSQKGKVISLNFSNPQPYYPIQDWFFGAAVEYAYDFIGSSLDAQINIISSVSANLSQEQITQSTVCSSQLLSSVQTSDGYFVFHQSSSCSLWFEKCIFFTSYDKIKFTESTNQPQTSYCSKSTEIQLSNQINSLIFDGQTFVIMYYQSAEISQVNQKTGSLFFGNIQTSFSSDNANLPNGQLTQINLGEGVLEQIDFLKLFRIPYASKFGVIIQSSSKQFKTFMTFKIAQTVSDITTFTFDDSVMYTNYETSLLDQGFLFAIKNQDSSQTSPGIKVLKVNFLTKICTTQQIFSQNIMIGQIQANQQQNTNQDSSLLDTNLLRKKGIVLVSDPAVFMNSFDIRIWRNNETQPYRLLMVDYTNNCLLDYYLYDILKPKFIRQIDLFDFTISEYQTLEISDNILVLKLKKDNQEYFVSLEINGESINQIQSIKQYSKEKANSIISVLKNPGFQYEEGRLCQVFSSPQSQIICTFHPFIRLNYDFGNTLSKEFTLSSLSSTNSNSQETSDSSNTSDKQVNFIMAVSTTLSQNPQEITLQTVFSNFDTNLISNNSNESETQHSYNVKRGISIRGEQTKRRYLPLDTSFVSGSIDQFYVNYISNENKSQSQQNVTIQGYVDTAGVKTSRLTQDTCLSIDKSNKNPYQLVCLAADEISIINQNMRFNFEKIYSIKYSDIKVQPVPESMFSQTTGEDINTAYVAVTVLNCTNIFSNEVQASQTTSTFLYILQCTVDIPNYTPFEQFLVFNVDVNHYDTLADQGIDWNKALTQEIRLLNVDLDEETFSEMISEIKDFSLISLTDELNNITGYILLMVREIQEADKLNNGDYRVYVLWGLNHPMNPTFYLEEINQINSSDFNLNSLVIYNFVAGFPYNYPNQIHIDLDVQKDFIFNIGWDDGKRYVTVALLKLVLPPVLDNSTYNDDNDSDNDSSQKIFNVQYQDIYGSAYTHFVKSSETWKSTLTSLKSMITFQTDSYNANVLITNEFSIIELSCVLSPAPYLQNSLQNTSDSSQSQQQILIFTQYAWCENQFSNDEKKQQILKYKQFLIIKCIQSSSAVSQTNISGMSGATSKAQASFILKIYKTQQQSSSKEKSSVNTQNKYSMAQAITLDPGKTINAMSFRTDNKALFLDLILSDLSNEGYYELQQYPVNTMPILVFSPDIEDQTQIQICAKNHFKTTPCENAVFSNIIIDTSSQSLHQWLLFSGLIAIPLLIVICFIFGSFVAIKKLRKSRQDEFWELLKSQNKSSIYKSQSDLSSFIGKSIDGDDEKRLQKTENIQEEINILPFQFTNGQSKYIN